MIYPTTYPQPTWRYAQELTTHQDRSQMECGWTRQRKAWPESGSSVELEFIMSTDTFDDWVQWVFTNGYQYFTILLDQYGSGRENRDIRFVTPVQYAYENFDTVRVTVAGELFTG